LSNKAGQFLNIFEGNESKKKPRLPMGNSEWEEDRTREGHWIRKRLES
jgi:hypothetical protein